MKMKRKPSYRLVFMSLVCAALGLFCFGTSLSHLISGNGNEALIFLGVCTGFIALGKIYGIEHYLYNQNIKANLICKWIEMNEGKTTEILTAVKRRLEEEKDPQAANVNDRPRGCRPI